MPDAIPPPIDDATNLAETDRDDGGHAAAPIPSETDADVSLVYSVDAGDTAVETSEGAKPYA